MQWNKFILIIGMMFGVHAFSQKIKIPDTLRQSAITGGYHSGFIFAHSIHVQNTKGTKPDGFEFEYSHLRTDSFAHVHFNCYARAGFNFTYIDFNKQLLGKSYSLSYFIEPNYRLGNSLRLNVRAAAGLSYLTNPFDSTKNPENQSYSLPINMFLQLGLGLSCPLNRHVSLYARGNFYHNSNGGFNQPNSGVNYINASFGLQYFSYSSHLPVYKKAKDSSWRKEPVHFDVAAFYSPKGGYSSRRVSERKFLGGISFQAVKRVASIDAISLGAEVYYDAALRSIKEIYLHDSSSSSTLAGVLLGHQFLLNRFTFSQQLGIYVYKQTDSFNRLYTDLFHTIYHRWGLNYQLNPDWFIGINLLAHNQFADFIDARVTYRLK